MKNMGLSKLYLVQPEVFPSDRALWRAAGAPELLDSAVVVDSLDQAIADCQLVIGTSARERRIPWPLENPHGAAVKALNLVDSSSGKAEVAYIFGREHSGLTNDELHKCHLHVHIPSNSEYSSLNLSAAVQVLTYELRMAMLGEKAINYASAPWDEELATAEELEHLYGHLERVMLETGFINPDNPRQTMTRLRRLFSRASPDVMEVQILRGLLTGIERKWHRD